MRTQSLKQNDGLPSDPCFDPFGEAFSSIGIDPWSWDAGSEPQIPVPEGDLLVWDPGNDSEIGVVVELGFGGMAFEYFELGFSPVQSGPVDLVSSSSSRICGILFETMADRRIEEESHSPVPIRRCIARFGPLDPARHEALETLIARYS